MILTTLLLFSLGKYWEITKALSYSGPLICVIFFSIIGSETIHSKKMTTLLIIFFLSNFLFAAKKEYHLMRMGLDIKALFLLLYEDLIKQTIGFLCLLV